MEEKLLLNVLVTQTHNQGSREESWEGRHQHQPLISTLTTTVTNCMKNIWSSPAMLLTLTQSSAAAVQKFQRHAVISGPDTPPGGRGRLSVL